MVGISIETGWAKCLQKDLTIPLTWKQFSPILHRGCPSNAIVNAMRPGDFVVRPRLIRTVQISSEKKSLVRAWILYRLERDPRSLRGTFGRFSLQAAQFPLSHRAVLCIPRLRNHSLCRGHDVLLIHVLAAVDPLSGWLAWIQATSFSHLPKHMSSESKNVNNS